MDWRLFVVTVREFLKLYCLAAFSTIGSLFTKHKKFEGEAPRDTNLVAIVTGGSGGIGRCVTWRLVKLGVHVIIGAHTEEEALAVINEIKEEIPKAKVDHIHLDLSSQASVRTFVHKFQKKELPLNILINNAGVMFPPYKKTEDGFELQFAVNYLGHFLLTQLLLPHLKTSATPDLYSRVVNVSSVAKLAGTIDFNNLKAEQYYSSHAAYMQSKLAIAVSTFCLQRQLTDENTYVTANCLHPGVVNTNLFRHVIVMPNWLRRLAGTILFKMSDQGADTELYAVLSPDLEARGGLYLDNCTETRSKAMAYKKDLQEKLWSRTVEFVGL